MTSMLFKSAIESGLKFFLFFLGSPRVYKAPKLLFYKIPLRGSKSWPIAYSVKFCVLLFYFKVLELSSVYLTIFLDGSASSPKLLNLVTGDNGFLSKYLLSLLAIDNFFRGDVNEFLPTCRLANEYSVNLVVSNYSLSFCNLAILNLKTST